MKGFAGKKKRRSDLVAFEISGEGLSEMEGSGAQFFWGGGPDPYGKYDLSNFPTNSRVIFRKSHFSHC